MEVKIENVTVNVYMSGNGAESPYELGSKIGEAVSRELKYGVASTRSPNHDTSEAS